MKKNALLAALAVFACLLMWGCNDLSPTAGPSPAAENDLDATAEAITPVPPEVELARQLAAARMSEILASSRPVLLAGPMSIPGGDIATVESALTGSDGGPSLVGNGPHRVVVSEDGWTQWVRTIKVHSNRAVQFQEINVHVGRGDMECFMSRTDNEEYFSGLVLLWYNNDGLWGYAVYVVNGVANFGFQFWEPQFRPMRGRPIDITVSKTRPGDRCGVNLWVSPEDIMLTNPRGRDVLLGGTRQEVRVVFP